MKTFAQLRCKTVIYALLVMLLFGVNADAKPKADVSYDKVLNRTRVSVQERMKRKSSGIFSGNAVSTVYYVVSYDYTGKTATYPPVLQWSFRRTTNEKNNFDAGMHKQQWADVTRVTLTAQGEKFEFTPFYDTDFDSKGTLFGRKFSSEERLTIAVDPETLEKIARASLVGFALESNSKIVDSDELDGGNLDSLSALLQTLPKDRKMAVLPLGKNPITGQTYVENKYDALDDETLSSAVVVYSPSAAFQVGYRHPGKTPRMPDSIRVGYVKFNAKNSWPEKTIKMRVAGEVKEHEAELKQQEVSGSPIESLGIDISLEELRAICKSEEVIFRAGGNSADTVTLKGYLLLPFQEILRQVEALPQPKPETETAEQTVAEVN